MAKTYSIPEILRLAAVRGYSPRLGDAVNRLLNSDNEIEYQIALRDATEETTGLHTYSDTNAYSDKSHFAGVPIYMPLVLEAFDSSVEDYLLESAIVSVTRQRKIITTELQGRDSDVFEFISNGNFEISVTGLICQPQVGYPKKLVSEFNRYVTEKKAIKVIHEALNNLGIFELVITDYSLPATPFINGQQYSFNAASHVPLELQLDVE